MTKISKEVKVGFTVIVSLFVLGWGINFLKGRDVFIPGYRLYGVFARIDGLTNGSPIYYKGFEIGAVRDITMREGSVNELVIIMSIDQKIDFPKNTIAQIYSLDLMGSKGIRFIYGDSKEMLMPEDTMVTSIMGGLAHQVSQEVLPLKDKAESLVVKLDSVMTNINQIFEEKSNNGKTVWIEDLVSAIGDLKEMSSTLNRSLKPNGALGESFANIDTLSLLLKNNGNSLTRIMENLESLSEQLERTHVDSVVNEFNQSLVAVNVVLNNLNNGDGTLGLLLKDKQLYNNLNEVSVSLDRLLEDIRHQPKRYLNVSAISFGGSKEPKGEATEGVVYKVEIKRSKRALDLRGKELFKDLFVVEDRDGKYYVYTIGEDRDYQKILQLKNAVIEMYPDAEVIALEDGNPVSVKSTL